MALSTGAAEVMDASRDGRGREEAIKRSRLHARTRFLTNAALLYVHLWIIEGAIRKWLPQLDSVMYVARDGVLVAALILALVMFGPPAGMRKITQIFWIAIVALVVIGMIQSSAGLMSPSVLLVGVRSYIAPLILPFLIMRDEIAEFGERAIRTVLYYAPIQALLVLVQVSSPKSGVINVQTGGEEAYFTTADGIVRASGTFSAPAGLILFATLALACGLAAVTGGIKVRPAFAWVGLLSSVLIVIIGGSRGAIFGALIVVSVWVLQSLLSGHFRRILLVAGAGALGLGVYLIASRAVPQVLDAFITRFETAAGQENSLVRLFGGAVGFLWQPSAFFGDGIGTHSTAGIALGSGYAWIEVDSNRWVAELGTFGLVLAGARLLLSIALLFGIAVKLPRASIAVLLISALLVQTGLFGSITTQPSSQGAFAILLAMLISLTMQQRKIRDAERDSLFPTAKPKFG